jgi:hypothetical protein
LSGCSSEPESSSSSGSGSSSSSNSSHHAYPPLPVATQSDVCTHVHTTCSCYVHESFHARPAPYSVPPAKNSTALEEAKAIGRQQLPRRGRPAAARRVQDLRPEVEDVRKGGSGSGSGSEGEGQGEDEDEVVEVEVLPHISGCSYSPLLSVHASEENWQQWQPPSTGSSKGSGGRKQGKGRRRSRSRQQPSSSSSSVSGRMHSLGVTALGTTLAVVFAAICACALAGCADGVASSTVVGSSGMSGYGEPYCYTLSQPVVTRNATSMWKLQPGCFAVLGVLGNSVASSAVVPFVSMPSLLAVMGIICCYICMGAWLRLASAVCGRVWPVVFCWIMCCVSHSRVPVSRVGRRHGGSVQ